VERAEKEAKKEVERAEKEAKEEVEIEKAKEKAAEKAEKAAEKAEKAAEKKAVKAQQEAEQEAELAKVEAGGGQLVNFELTIKNSRVVLTKFIPQNSEVAEDSYAVKKLDDDDHDPVLVTHAEVVRIFKLGNPKLRRAVHLLPIIDMNEIVVGLQSLGVNEFEENLQVAKLPIKFRLLLMNNSVVVIRRKDAGQ
jgi:vacuolar-type H+-ATPase subunit H